MGRSERKAETRAQLLTAARDVFDEHGYERASIKAVARTAGVAVGTVYTHFADKSALAVAAFEDDIQRTVVQAWATMPPGEPRAQLVHLGTQLLRYYNQRPALSRALLKAILFAQRDDPQTPAFLQRIAMLLSDARYAGHVRMDADVEGAAQAFFANYYLILIGGMAGHIPTLDAQVALLTRQVDLLFAGIGGSS